MRIVFFGSPNFALPSLSKCLNLDNAEVVAIVTQPDRRQGRKSQLVPTPVKSMAIKYGITNIFQPSTITTDIIEKLSQLKPDIGIVVASGHILPEQLLAIFPNDVLNLHGSLLPKHRGASAVANAIIMGDSESGATIMKIVKEVDAGPILGQIRTPILITDTTSSLSEKIANIGSDLLIEILPKWINGEIQPKKQNDQLATNTKKLKKSDGRINWYDSSNNIALAVRALNPWPLANTIYKQQLFVIHQAWSIPDYYSEEKPGTIIEIIQNNNQNSAIFLKNTIAVVCGEGALGLIEIQRSGKKIQSIKDYLNGDRSFVGSNFD
ncbi:MAG: methionyl-tRNA formyltransferase [Dehalococcoidia bacterium]|nr:methionyl-tRNA formyltransferase [Dehalococcoidia bacterium]